MSDLFRRLCAGIAAGASLLCCAVAAAQFPVQQGNALDANTRLGGFGLNSAVRRDYSPSGNQFVTGNVTGGGYFRASSPIRDGSSLLVSLPSTSLGSFQSNSVGIRDIAAGRTNIQPNSFYLSSQTAAFANSYNPQIAPNRSFAPTNVYSSQPQPPLGSVGRPGIPTALGADAYRAAIARDSTGRLGLRPDTLRDAGVSGDGRLGAIDALDYRGAGQGGPLALPRGVFDFGGLSPAPALPAIESPMRTLQSPLERTPSSGRIEVPAFGPPAALEGTLNRARTLIDMDALSRRGLANLRQRELDPFTGQIVRRKPFEAPRPSRPELADRSAAGEQKEPRSNAPTWPTRPAAPQPSANGADLAGDSQAAADALFRPAGRETLADVQGAFRWIESARKRRARSAAAAGSAGPAGLPAAPAALDRDSLESARRIVGDPLSTYAGESDARANEYIRQAEELVRKGEYYRASGTYETASAIDRDNPLIDLGWGHALIGAGEYVTAVRHLTRGLDRFPDLIHLNIDLSQFIPDVNVLDARRADLETRLAQTEDHELRFLLGYIEYYGGLRRFGAENLRRAAAQAPAGSIIARVPGLLSVHPLEGLNGADAKP